MIGKIVLDLQNFDQNAPMGAIAYDGDEVICSEYCSDADDFKEFLEEYREDIECGARIVVLAEADDFMYSGEVLVDMVTEIKRNFN